MTGRITDVSKTLDGKFKVTLALDFADGETIDELMRMDKLTIDIKKYHPKRSLDANAYCWALIHKLSAKLGMTPTEIYQALIRDVGDNFDVVIVKDEAVEKLRRIWESKGIGFITDATHAPLKPGFSYLYLYYGSSTYNTAQMSRLINLVVAECKIQNIETMTPAEIASLEERWKPHD